MTWRRVSVGVAIFGCLAIAQIAVAEIIERRQTARRRERVVLLHPTYYRSPA